MAVPCPYDRLSGRSNGGHAGAPLMRVAGAPMARHYSDPLYFERSDDVENPVWAQNTQFNRNYQMRRLHANLLQRQLHALFDGSQSNNILQNQTLSFQ